MKKTLAAASLGLFVAAVMVFAQDHPAPAIPKEIKGAQEALTEWLSGFPKKTKEQIEKQLGPPTETTTWKFKGKKETLFRYRPSETGTLSINFLGEQAVKAEFKLYSR
jgi:hypothetical protein